tara:strand:+ start:203 stop:592 length:390 start_codon:yes stop_codon:yes gene_type:complete
MIKSVFNYIFIIISGYIVLLGFFSGLGIELEAFPQSLLKNKLYQMFLAYIVLHESFGGDAITVIVILLLYYLTSLLFSKNKNKYNNIFGHNLGPYVKEAMIDLGVEEYTHEFNSGDMNIIIGKIKNTSK